MNTCPEISSNNFTAGPRGPVPGVNDAPPIRPNGGRSRSEELWQDVLRRKKERQRKTPDSRRPGGPPGGKVDEYASGV